MLLLTSLLKVFLLTTGSFAMKNVISNLNNRVPDLFDMCNSTPSSATYTPSPVPTFTVSTSTPLPTQILQRYSCNIMDTDFT